MEIHQLITTHLTKCINGYNLHAPGTMVLAELGENAVIFNLEFLSPNQS